MKNVISAALLAAAVLVASGCGLFAEEEETKSFVIIDQDTNDVLNEYKYSSDGKTLLKTLSYDSDQKVSKTVTYEYDDAGYLARTVSTPTGGSETAVTWYTEEVYDDNDRLIQISRSASDGTELNTYFGYDEDGELRGVVEQHDDESVFMKDY